MRDVYKRQGLTGFEQTTRQDLDRDGCRSLAHADHDRLVTQDVHVATFNGGVVVDDLFVEEEVELLVLEDRVVACLLYTSRCV